MDLIVERNAGYMGKDRDKLKVEVRNKGTYEKAYKKVIAGKDYNLLAILFFDLHLMGFNIDKAYSKFNSMVKEINEPDLFFLK